LLQRHYRRVILRGGNEMSWILGKERRWKEKFSNGEMGGGLISVYEEKTKQETESLFYYAITYRKTLAK
jgi:hypothetical protein